MDRLCARRYRRRPLRAATQHEDDIATQATSAARPSQGFLAIWKTALTENWPRLNRNSREQQGQEAQKGAAIGSGTIRLSTEADDPQTDTAGSMMAKTMAMLRRSAPGVVRAVNVMRPHRDLEQQHVERRTDGLHGAQAEIIGQREFAGFGKA